ncbi:helix-turn-helix transcriptional regulator [Cryobacterium sp. SO1]|uniref:ArsR/SmtB family transcription factor n=1 Tax=Cryobacterium sp. SO1 TaxID=1897061 RepID=UPI001022C9DA|nr:metalloregulator ArsR/SmtB family transcription factor [Cryobacterium sp. SO1]
MASGAGVIEAAEIFKALSSPARLEVLRLLALSDMSVTALVGATGLSQPLMSQHLGTLRSARLVAVRRIGREATYSIVDRHIAHIVEDAISHVLEEDLQHTLTK